MLVFNVAFTVFAKRLTVAALSPPKRRIIGAAKRSKITSAETGYPGRPRIGLPQAFAKIVGLPGAMEMPWKTNSESGNDKIVSRAISFAPIELPPERSTKSPHARASLRRQLDGRKRY